MDALDSMLTELWLNSRLRYNCMNSIEKIVASRQKTVEMLKARIAEYKVRSGALPPGAAKKAIESLTVIDEQRLVRVEAELAGFRELLTDPRQAELPAVPPRKK